MTPATFVALFPEFVETNAVLISGKLQLAAVRMGGPDTTVWGAFASAGQAPTIADLAQANLAAHMLWTSPTGTSTLLAASKGGKVSDTYLEEFERLELAMCSGPVTAGVSVSSQIGPPAGGIVLTAQFVTVAVVNGSNAVTFAQSQVLQAGTIVVFGSQPGALYTLALNVNGTTGQLMSPYTGASNAATTWSASLT